MKYDHGYEKSPGIKKDLSNRRYGKLLVLEESKKRKYNGKTPLVTWVCKCDCGNITLVPSSALGSGNTSSCGCNHVGNTKHGKCYTPEYRIFYASKTRARRKKVPFNLTIEDIVIPEYCPIFPDIKLVVHEGRPQDDSPSLDRLIPEKGYVKGNVHIISQKANRIKNNASLEDLKAIVNWLEKEAQ